MPKLKHCPPSDRTVAHLYLTAVILYLDKGDCSENVHVVFHPNNSRGFSRVFFKPYRYSFMCLDLYLFVPSEEDRRSRQQKINKGTPTAELWCRTCVEFQSTLQPHPHCHYHSHMHRGAPSAVTSPGHLAAPATQDKEV